MIRVIVRKFRSKLSIYFKYFGCLVYVTVLQLWLSFVNKKIVFPMCGLRGICFYINIKTFSVFRDCSSINSVRLLTGFYLLIFLIDTKSWTEGFSWKKEYFFLCIYLLTEFLAKFGIHIHLGAPLWFWTHYWIEKLFKMRKTGMYLNCLLICCPIWKKAIEGEINSSLAFCSCVWISSWTKYKHSFWKTEKQQVSICLKIFENCWLLDIFGSFQFSNVSLTVAVISFGFLTFIEEEIKSWPF